MSHRWIASRATMPPTRLLAGVATMVLAWAPAAAESVECSGYAAALRQMVVADQALRSRWDFSESAPSAEPPRIVQLTDLVDRQNTARLKSLLRRCGWPRRSVHGAAAVDDAWLLAQHADRDRPFQQVALARLRDRVAQGEAPADHLAYLTDRVALAEGRPQLYGTQLTLKAPCELDFLPLDDRAKVEARRKAIGWPSLDEYRQLVLSHAMPGQCRPQQQPPPTASP